MKIVARQSDGLHSSVVIRKSFILLKRSKVNINYRAAATRPNVMGALSCAAAGAT